MKTIKKYYLKKGHQELKFGDVVTLSTPVDTPYGKGEAQVEVTVDENIMRQLIKDNFVIVTECPLADKNSDKDLKEKLKESIEEKEDKEDKKEKEKKKRVVKEISPLTLLFFGFLLSSMFDFDGE